jgi:hypothetical protein
VGSLQIFVQGRGYVALPTCLEQTAHGAASTLIRFERNKIGRTLSKDERALHTLKLNDDGPPNDCSFGFTDVLVAPEISDVQRNQIPEPTRPRAPAVAGSAAFVSDDRALALGNPGNVGTNFGHSRFRPNVHGALPPGVTRFEGDAQKCR